MKANRDALKKLSFFALKEELMSAAKFNAQLAGLRAEFKDAAQLKAQHNHGLFKKAPTTLSTMSLSLKNK